MALSRPTTPTARIHLAHNGDRRQSPASLRLLRLRFPAVPTKTVPTKTVPTKTVPTKTVPTRQRGHAA